MKATGTWTKRNQQAVARAYEALTAADRTGTRKERTAARLTWAAAVQTANREAH